MMNGAHLASGGRKVLIQLNCRGKMVAKSVEEVISRNVYRRDMLISV